MTETSPPLAGVVGWPIAHSRSPVLHNHWLKRYNLPGYYIPIPLKPQDFEAGIRMLPRLGFKGVNLTIPYKEMILPLAEAVSDRASLIGAANTITFHADGAIHADNTDGIGFLSSVQASAPDWSAKAGPALILGAGGAARAVISALLNAGAPEVRIANRTRQKAEMLSEHFGGRATAVDWATAGEAADGAMTIVNTTALGMQGKPPLTISLDAAPAGATVVDIVYNPLDTDLLLRARQRKLRTVDGLGMLLYQAVPGFESWFGKKPDVDDTLRQVVLGA